MIKPLMKIVVIPTWYFLFTILLSSCNPPSSNNENGIFEISQNKDTLGAFDLFEVDIKSNNYRIKKIEQPYNKNEISISANIITPDDCLKNIEGFYYQDYKNRYQDGIERLTKSSNPYWKIRYTPTNTGIYEYEIIIQYKGKKYKSSKKQFVVKASERKGFIRKCDDHYMQFDNKDPYFAIGMSVAWVDKYRTISEYEHYFKKLSQSNSNYSRIWIVEWSLPLEWIDNDQTIGDVKGLGWYSQENSWKLDKIIRLAEKYDLYLLFTLGTYSDLSEEKLAWNEDKWKSNPYNITNGGMCESPEEFFTNTRAKDYYKQKLAYIISRWGYSPNILAFELWNEYDSPLDWTREMTKYLKKIDPNDHLITTSTRFQSQEKKSSSDSLIWSLPNIDYTQTHLYGNKGDIHQFSSTVNRINRKMTGNYNKPHILAEIGIDYLNSDIKYDPEGRGIQLHNVAWTSLMSESFGMGMTHWKEYIDSLDLYHIFKSISNFTKDINWHTNDFKKMEFDLRLPKNQYPDMKVVAIYQWGKKQEKAIEINNNGYCSDTIFTYVYGKSSINESFYFVEAGKIVKIS